MATSFQSDVLPLFTSDDISHMKNQSPPVYLDDYKWMSDPGSDNQYDNANSVYSAVAPPNAFMPIDDNGNLLQWSDSKVSTFKQWMDDGYQP
jgi:hypothetical protein